MSDSNMSNYKTSYNNNHYNNNYEIVFTNIKYYLSIIYSENNFKIILEDEDVNFWIGIFDSDMINKLTKKLNPIKTITLFIKCL